MTQGTPTGFPQSTTALTRPFGALPFLRSKILWVDAFQELAELLHLFFVLVVADDDGRLVEDGLVGEDRRAQAGGQGNGVGWPARHRVPRAVRGHLDLGVEGALPKLCD